VVSATYEDLFIAISGASGALTGLLFVALSVTPRAPLGTPARVIQQIRSGAALIAFSNALSVSLFSLVPGTHVGYPAAVLGLIGLAFTAAAIRSIRDSGATPRQQLRQTGFAVLLLLIFGTELAGALTLLIGSTDATTPLEIIGYALVTSLIFGVARAWELVGEWNTNFSFSIATLAGLTHRHDNEAAPRGNETVEAPPGGPGVADGS
jgi:hypothetical protein